MTIFWCVHTIYLFNIYSLSFNSSTYPIKNYLNNLIQYYLVLEYSLSSPIDVSKNLV